MATDHLAAGAVIPPVVTPPMVTPVPPTTDAVVTRLEELRQLLERHEDAIEAVRRDVAQVEARVTSLAEELPKLLEARPPAPAITWPTYKDPRGVIVLNPCGPGSGRSC